MSYSYQELRFLNAPNKLGWNKGPVEKQNNDFSFPEFVIFIGLS